MAEIDITQNEADALLALAKHRVDDRQWKYPAVGGSLTIPLSSEDKKESFFLDIRRSRIDLAKGTYQNRGRQVVILARLDFGGQPHRNPDGEEVPSPHLHLYREGFGDKWAMPLPSGRFPNLTDLRKTLDDFMAYCNVATAPQFEAELF